MSRDRAIVDDATPLWRLRFHDAKRMLCAEEQCRQVDIDDPLPILKLRVRPAEQLARWSLRC